MTSTKIYRATHDGYRGPWSCWSTDLETAEAYTDNPGFGGFEIIEGRLLGNVLDLRDEKAGINHQALGEALGMDWENWRMVGWEYPWEHSKAVAKAMIDSDYDWIAYLDDYPEYAETRVSLRGV